ncbi:MAG: stage II sporulation protein R [Clostridia bacterium]|nr:stage II sporulation protein R [Clostridia bacterium]
MQRRLLIATLVLSSLLLIVGVLPINGEAQIYDTVVRLHVLANSDSEEDQALKLEVRDAILEVTAPCLAGCEDRDEALLRLEAAMPDLQAAAERVIGQAGKGYDVSIGLGLEDYPRRDYDSVCFPAGEYVSMRVCIGEAEGQNWWCCLFPPLCLGAASVSQTEAEDACISVGFTPSQYKIITESDAPVYHVRFRLLELLQG